MMKLLKRTFNAIILLLVIIIITLAAVFMRLSAKPMDAAFLVNLTHQYLTIPQELSFTKTQLFWPKGSYGPELILKDAQWRTKTGVVPLGDIGVATDVVKLLNGDVALAKVSFRNIKFIVNDGDFGSFQGLLQPKSQDSNSPDVQKLYSLLSRLGAIVIEGAHIAFHDTKLEQTYYSPKFTASLFAQDDQFQLLGILDDQYKMLKKPAQLYASLHKDSLALTGKFYLENLDLRPLNQYSYLNKFITINQAENINIAANFAGNFQDGQAPILDVQWQLRSRGLNLNMQGSDLPSEVSMLNIDGSWSLASNIIGLKSIDLEVKKDGGMLYGLAIKNAKATGYINLSQQYINIANAQIETQQNKIVNASYKASWQDTKIKHMRHAVSAKSNDVISLEEVMSFWPKSVAKQAKTWVEQNIKGQFSDIFIGASFFLGEDKIVHTNFNGNAKIQQGYINYSAKFPAIENITANVDLNGQDIDFSIISADSGGINVKNAGFKLSSVHHKQQPMMSVHVPLDISVAQALTYGRFFSANLLSFIKDSDKELEGNIQGNINFGLAISNKAYYNALTLEQLNFSGSGTLIDLNYPAQQLASKELKYNLQKDQIQLQGGASVQSLALSDIDLIYPFDPDQSWSLKAKSTAKIEALSKSFPDLQPVIKQLNWQGNISSNIAVSGKKSIDVVINSDLAQSSFEAAPLGLVKAKGKSAALVIDTKINNGVAENVSLNFNSDKTKLRSSLNFKTGKLQFFEISEFSYGKTQLKGKYIPLDDKNLLNLSGNLDLSSYDVVAGTKQDNDTKKDKPLEISLELGTVYLQNFDLIKVQAVAMMRNSMLYSLNVAASTSDNTPFSANITPQKTGRKLTVKAQNGGRIIRGFNLYPHIEGGVLQIDAFAPFDRKSTWFGSVRMNKFTLVKAPTLTHLLGVLNLVQLNSSLSGVGLLFDSANVPFTLSNGVMAINQAEIVGPSLGGKLDGTVDFNQDLVNFTGKVIPFSTISGITSQVPILGQLLSGANKDGIFVADFKITGKRSEPVVTTNPLSTIAPGIIRDIFKSLN